jgi:hypothetical protein
MMSLGCAPDEYDDLISGTCSRTFLTVVYVATSVEDSIIPVAIQMLDF